MGKRGRPPKALPLHSGRVLAKALKTGLSLAVYLQRAMADKNTRHLYESSRRIWKKAKRRYHRSVKQGRPDYATLVEAERNIRKNMLQMLFEKTAAYGNTEVHRVKSSHESIGPLNQLFNIGGAVLRNTGVEWYPFPEMCVLYLGTGEVAFGFQALIGALLLVIPV